MIPKTLSPYFQFQYTMSTHTHTNIIFSSNGLKVIHSLSSFMFEMFISSWVVVAWLLYAF